MYIHGVSVNVYTDVLVALAVQTEVGSRKLMLTMRNNIVNIVPCSHTFKVDFVHRVSVNSRYFGCCLRCAYRSRK